MFRWRLASAAARLTPRQRCRLARARQRNLALDDPRLMAAARAVGADVPVCLDLQPRIMRGIGEVLSRAARLAGASRRAGQSRRCSGDARCVCENSQVHDAGYQPCATCRTRIRRIDRSFRQQEQRSDRRRRPPARRSSRRFWRPFARVPGIALARMSGSGATCFALFGTPAEEAAAAAHCLKRDARSWWVQATTIGAVALELTLAVWQKRLTIRQLRCHRRNAGCTMQTLLRGCLECGAW